MANGGFDISPAEYPSADECPNREVNCIHSNKGCNWRDHRNMLQGHINLNQRYEGCGYVEFDCIHECGSREERRKLEEHEQGCLKKTVKENKADIQTLRNSLEQLDGRIKRLQHPDTQVMREIQFLKNSIIAILSVGSSLIVLVAALLAQYQYNSVPSVRFAASSCAEILSNNPDSPSGYYMIKNITGLTHTVYCDMTKSCGGITGGWKRVAYLDMSNSSHQCPSGLTQFTYLNVRACAPISDSATCSSVLFDLHSTPYSKVCGKILGGDILTCDGFINRGSLSSLDSNYVDGVSLTHGSPSRSHIWTFAAGTFAVESCLCGDAPNVIGSHYFCDGSDYIVFNYIDTIWDGDDEDYCTFNNPPWFYRQLAEPTTDDIEMRVCRDQNRDDEDVIVKVIEIYVQ